MNIYFLRHGDAENSSHKVRDNDRRLTADGIEKLKRAAGGWKHLLTGINHIISSPLVRAIETAEIIKQIADIGSEIIIDQKIASGASPADFADAANYHGGDNIIFVGHEPDISYCISELISSSGMRIDIKKGMIVKINFHNRVKSGKGSLEFQIPVSAYK